MATALLAGAVLVGLAVADPAQNPGEVVDTVYTPSAKDNAKDFGWKQVAGAVFDDQARDQARGMGYDERDSPVPPSVDFYAVSFLNTDNGLAAGAECRDPGADVGDCVRVPVIYRYQRPDPSKPPEWTRTFRGDQPGFVGAVGWLGTHKAVAVGGTGCFPRREVAEDPVQNEAATPAHCPRELESRLRGRVDADGDGEFEQLEERVAGDAQAWVLEDADGGWESISSHLPKRMTGLTALAFSPRPKDCRAILECGFAGGMGQIWVWKDGAFRSAPSYACQRSDNPCDPPRATPPRPQGLQTLPTYPKPEQPNDVGNNFLDSPFRVRQIAFKGGATTTAIAVTSGCCYTRLNGQSTGHPDPYQNYPRTLTYSNPAGGEWEVESVLGRSAPARRADTLPDSLYSVAYAADGCPSAVATPGGPAGAPGSVETSSRIIHSMGCQGTPGYGLLIESGPGQNDRPFGSDLISNNPEVSSVRLVAGDGDLEAHPLNAVHKASRFDRPAADTDGIIDWAVGELDSRGVAYTTTTKSRGLDAPYPLSCPDDDHVSVDPSLDNSMPGITPRCSVGDADAGSAQVLWLPSYPLNAFTAVGTSGTSWAAGDRGALLKLGVQAGAGGTQGASSAPKLGTGQPTALSNREAYDAFRPILSGRPGLVPPLSARPEVEVPGGRLVPWGSPDPHLGGRRDTVEQIAMSRDGSEGWAVGSSGGSTGRSVLVHFDGGRWSRCDPVGIEGVIAPDRACASLAELMTFHGTGVNFRALARVPTEYGDDRSAAGDFEAVALAEFPSGARKWAVLRFRDGEWDLDRAWSDQLRDLERDSLSLAFGSPDDAWVVSSPANNVHKPTLFRLSDGRWTRCDNDVGKRGGCLDDDSVLPLTTNEFHGRVQGAFGLRVTSAGSRVYLYGTRRGTTSSVAGQDVGVDQNVAGQHLGSADRYPAIFYEDVRDGDDRQWTAQYDPKYGVGCAGSCAGRNGALNALSVVRGPDGGYTGWGVGDFGLQSREGERNPLTSHEGQTPLLRLGSDGRTWAPVPDPGPAASEYLQSGLGTPEVVALPGTGSALAVPGTSPGRARFPMTWLNPASRRWEAFATPFTMSYGDSDGFQQAFVTAVAPDNRGGSWLVAANPSGSGAWFYRFSRRVRRPVFSDVAHPVREDVTATAGGGDGSFWVATKSGRVYRHDRVTGWDRVSLKGWDVGGVVESPAYGVAVGADGEGVVVGKAGRIAAIGPRAVALDPASVLCSSSPDDCATKQTLRAAAIAPDGSALAGGDGGAVVWRAAGGRFQAVARPDVARAARITSIAMPRPDRAWLATSAGDVMAGQRAGGDWRWVREDVDRDGGLLARDEFGTSLALNGIAVDERGHGFAVGADGVILERTGDGPRPWRRLRGYGENLRAVTLGPGGEGAIVGGDGGLVLTLAASGEFEVARPSDHWDPLTYAGLPGSIGGVVGVALLPGSAEGEVEAWAATRGGDPDRVRPSSPSAILHYASDPDDPLTDAGVGRARPLPDSPARQDGELDLAAFGKSECRIPEGEVCPEPIGTALSNEVTARGVRDDLLEAGARPDLALFTGDAADVGGSRRREWASLPTDVSVMHERWSEQIADPLARAGVPVFGALGAQDLSHTQSCVRMSIDTCPVRGKELGLRAGLNVGWRKAFAGAPAPWGTGQASSHSGLTFREVSSFGVRTQAAPLAGAHTHYAADVRRDGRNVLRLVVLDTSLRTVSGVAALQNPVRDQLAWLDGVLSAKTGRLPDQPAVVVSETPSYTYQSNAGATTDTLLDAAEFETLLVKNHASAVVSGRLGWNGLYWLVAPGLHTPCPGGSYQPDPPRDASQLCQATDSSPLAAADEVADTLEQGGLNAPVPRPSRVFQDVAGLANIPVAVAASAGGRFGPDGRGGGSGAQGFWRGYTRVRIFPGKDLVPVVEQRPVFSWIGIRAADHTLAPGRRLALHGYGREPVGIEEDARYVDIDGPAITHRYDLVLADPQRPYLPKVDPTNEEPNHYVPVPEELGASIDRQTGTVRYTGRGDHPPVYALAILSVGEKAATWPIVLAPRRSFRSPPPPRALRVQLPPPPRALGTAPATLPPPPPAQIPNPPSLDLHLPPPPPLPTLKLNAPQTQAPAPPAPPPPPVSPAASALQLAPAPVGLNVAPAATVIPPPAPPIQPAPPSGARREARQRQAAAAKSEEGAQKESAEKASAGGTPDKNAQASRRLTPEPRSAFTERRRNDLAYTAYERHRQASAWTRDLLYGGGLGLGALTLALGWSLLRPTPRRRTPELPVPAWARNPHDPTRDGGA